MSEKYTYCFDSFVILFEIDKCLRKEPAPSFADIQKQLAFVLCRPVAKRSLQWYFEMMRYNERLKFYAPIKYCRFKKTYSYADKEYSILKALANPSTPSPPPSTTC